MGVDYGIVSLSDDVFCVHNGGKFIGQRGQLYLMHEFRGYCLTVEVFGIECGHRVRHRHHVKP